MFKRMSLVFMLLTALVGIAGVQAQTAAEPQSMAQYVPADSQMFFSIRTDGAFLDEISTLVNGVIEKLPEAVQAQAEMLDLRGQIEGQIGPISETGVGDYVAMSASNFGVLYDQDRSNDDEVVFYFVADLADRAKFEAFLEKTVPEGNFEKTEEDGMTIYAPGSNSSGGEGQVVVTDDVIYVTNQADIPSGDMLADSGDFTGALSNLPEPNYNFVAYFDYGAFFSAMMDQMPSAQTEIFSDMGLDLSNYGSMAFGGTVLDGKALVLDAYAPAFEGFEMNFGSIDPEFANILPADTSFVVHSTNLQALIDVYVDLIVKAMEAQPNQNQQLSREQINGLLQVYLGVDLDNDILPWLGGDFALIADLDTVALMDAVRSNDLQFNDLPLEPHFAFVTETDGSEKPGEFVAAIGKLLVQQTENSASAPEISVDSNDDGTTIIIEDVAAGSGIELNIQITGNGEFFIAGDQATVEAILSGEGGFAESAGFVEAQQYILPNAASVAYAGGEGWADLVSLGGLLVVMNAPSSNGPDTQTELVLDVLDSLYDIFGSSSLSATMNADGSQNTRMVFTFK